MIERRQECAGGHRDMPKWGSGISSCSSPPSPPTPPIEILKHTDFADTILNVLHYLSFSQNWLMTSTFEYWNIQGDQKVCAPDYSTKNAQKCFKQFQSLIMIT
jgi:hypothetical protein